MRPPKVSRIANAKTKLGYPWPFPIVITNGKVYRVVVPREQKPKLDIPEDAPF